MYVCLQDGGQVTTAKVPHSVCVRANVVLENSVSESPVLQASDNNCVIIYEVKYQYKC